MQPRVAIATLGERDGDFVPTLKALHQDTRIRKWQYQNAPAEPCASVWTAGPSPAFERPTTFMVPKHVSRIIKAFL